MPALWANRGSGAGAAAEAIYDLVADVKRMGEWSPVCTGGEHELVRWGFSFRPLGPTSTEVTQSWAVLPGYPDGFAAEGPGRGELSARLDFMQSMAETGMPETLARLRGSAESVSSQ